MAIIGIDLGTTNSACGVMRGEEIVLIPNRLGELLTPSVVGFDDSEQLLVGRTAKERLISHGDKTVAVFKRLVGTDHRIKIGKKEFTAAELSSLVLRALKEDAEAFLGEPVTDAVISVPAYFNDNQRLATKQAGELAGLKVDRLINEPTAAAMAYGLQEKEEGTFIVLDMGGGTFDVSILEFFDGVMEVHASAGDNFLGGEDFVDAMVSDILAQYKVERSELSKQQLNTLFMQMETLKRRIDTQVGQTLNIQLGSKSHQWLISEQWFAGVCTPLLLRAKQPIERAIRDANIAVADIEDIILVGGSTRLKMFRNNIGRLFGRIPSSTIDPDIVVAQGAAVQAALIEKNQALNDVVLTDVCPYTLGTEVNGPDGQGGGYFLPIIERNSVVPISVVRTLQTASDNQTTVEVNIYQGENRLTEKNVFLGTVNATVPKGPAGKEMLDVRYSYDMNGLLEVDLTIISTGKVINKVIENNPGKLTEKDLQASKKRLAALKFHPREQEENSALLAKGERLFESNLGEKREYIAALLADFEKVLDGQQPLEIKKARIQLSEILTELDNEDWI